MKIITATATTGEFGPLTKVALAFAEKIESLTTGAGVTAADWEPLSDYIAVDEFERVGAYMEVLSWPEYVRFLTAWAGGVRFETTVFRISEIGNVVMQEIEERHYKGEDFIRKNVIAVYEFDDANKIRHLDIYEQARDTGRWIVDAAEAAQNPD